MARNKQYLHDLLKEDQEPFHLKAYISRRKNLLNRDDNFAQIKKPKPIIETSILKQSLCKRGCLFSFWDTDSPDVLESTVGVPSPASGNGGDGRVLLNVPARTAALLLEAAMRIQGSGKVETRIRNCGLGLFGSVLRKLKDRNCKGKMREIKDVRIRDELGISSGYNRNRRQNSAAGWSESNGEEKSSELEASTSSCRSEESEEIVDSPFRFSLHRCPSTGRRTPEFSSPAASPCRHKKQDKENCENEDLEKVKQEDDSKEQCSPVSVLDHSFEDDDYRPDEEDDGEDDGDLECNYSMLQRAQQELLNKLHRFEQLAELDPFELEKILLEEDSEEDEVYKEEDNKDTDRSGVNMERLICCRDGVVNPYTKRKVLEQSSEEEKTENNRKLVWGRVCERLESGRTEFGEWKNYCGEEVEEIAMEIELVMFGVLVEELSQELCGSLN